MNPSDAGYLARVMAFSGLWLALLWFAEPAAARERNAMQACRTDAQQLCPGVQPGGGRIAACLRENEPKLSAGCHAQLGKVEACAAEMKKICPQAQGEAALRACVKEKRGEISAGCRMAAGE
jgi:Cysteine rich repeat